MRIFALILAIVSTQVMTPEFCGAVMSCGTEAKTQPIEQVQICIMKKACCKNKDFQPKQNKSRCKVCPKKLIALGPELMTQIDVLRPSPMQSVDYILINQMPWKEIFNRLEHPPPRALFCVWRI